MGGENTLTKSGEYAGVIFKLLTAYLHIDLAQVTRETGFTESALSNFFEADVIPKDFAERLLTAMRLTQSDYTWFQLVLSEVKEDRDIRIQKIESMERKIRYTEKEIEENAKRQEEAQKQKHDEAVANGLYSIAQNNQKRSEIQARRKIRKKSSKNSGQAIHEITEGIRQAASSSADSDKNQKPAKNRSSRKN